MPLGIPRQLIPQRAPGDLLLDLRPCGFDRCGVHGFPPFVSGGGSRYSISSWDAVSSLNGAAGPTTVQARPAVLASLGGRVKERTAPNRGWRAVTIRVALAGDTMLGRGVARRLLQDPDRPLFAPEVTAAARGADLFVLNLECCISARGERWRDPGKPFFFRAPPVAAERLRELGVDTVTLANNHALDYGSEALADTCAHLDRAGIAWVGAGPDEVTARRPQVVKAGGMRVAIVGFADHPPAFAAGRDRPGIAHVDLAREVPGWLRNAIDQVDADLVLLTPHWGPNMVPAPVPQVRRAAQRLVDAGAGLIAGHSAHVFHGAAQAGDSLVLYDLGDFIDDYAVEETLRNDLGLLWLLDIGDQGPVRLEAVPLALDFCFTRVAKPHEAAWIAARLRRACAEFGTAVRERDGRLLVGMKEVG
ncbi:MAG: CapA family protein [Nitriliruptorales bacterium]|nr:CapA family protein [Nitriliruptorales bacterium]